MPEHCKNSKQWHGFRALIEVINNISRSLEIDLNFMKKKNINEKDKCLFLLRFQEASVLFSFKFSMRNKYILECFSVNTPLFQFLHPFNG